MSVTPEQLQEGARLTADLRVRARFGNEEDERVAHAAADFIDLCVAALREEQERTKVVRVAAKDNLGFLQGLALSEEDAARCEAILAHLKVQREMTVPRRVEECPCYSGREYSCPIHGPLPSAGRVDTEPGENT